jgi:Trypsin-like peptidase domain
MRNIYLVVLLILTEFSPLSAQFKPEVAEKSLVKVMVTGGGKLGVCSGFIWKKKSWVVTSLHAMKPNGTIEVEYPGGNIRDARVINVFESADLVLLETNVNAMPVTNEVLVLSGYTSGKPEFGDKIYALGYNGGSLGNQTQVLEKGHANPETLEFLVREQDKASLASVGFPSMKIPIYFLSGSLLPGFSGSPVYNTRNELIGIGDGGLERGQMNVSWCIPASNLDILETSPPTLPARLGEASLLYSADVSIEVKSDDPRQNYQTATEQLEKKYKSYSYGDFTFYQTKTRTLKEMMVTAVDAENLVGFAEEFEELKIHIDYDDFDFDIYEDAGNGFVLAIPGGTKLTYDADLKMFQVDLSAFEGGEYFNFATEAFGEQTQGLTQDPKYTRSFQLNKEWRDDFLVLQGNAAYETEGLGSVLPLIFTSIISNDKEAFYSFAICFVPANRQDIAQAFQNGLDCVNNYNGDAACCDYFGWLFHMIAASNLTSLSSTQ